MIKPALAGDRGICRPLKRALNFFGGGTQGGASLHFVSLRLPWAKFFRLLRRLIESNPPSISHVYFVDSAKSRFSSISQRIKIIRSMLHLQIARPQLANQAASPARQCS